MTIALCLLPDKETCEQWQQQGTPGYPSAEHSASHTSRREETQQQEEEARLDCTSQHPHPLTPLSALQAAVTALLEAQGCYYCWIYALFLKPVGCDCNKAPPTLLPQPSAAAGVALVWSSAICWCTHCRGEQHSSRARCLTEAHSCCCILIHSFYKSQNFVPE